MNGKNRPRLSLSVFFVLVFAGLAWGAHAVPLAPPPTSSLDLKAGVQATLRKGGNPLLDSALNELLRGDRAGAAIQTAESLGLELEGERVEVTVILLDEEESGAVRQAIADLGGEVTAHYKRWIDARVPLAALEALAARRGIGQIARPIEVFPVDGNVVPVTAPYGAGSYITAGVVSSNAYEWQNGGYTGSGVKIGILDSFQDYGTAQGLGELPVSISTLGTLNTSSRHGTACAEIIHDMAPGAPLTFASPSTATDMASKIVQLAQSGHKVISSSMGFYNAEPGDGTGPVADAVTTAHDTYGTLYVQAAGNQANYHWDGNFVDTDGDGWHEYGTINGVAVEVNELDLLPFNLLLYLNLRWNGWPVTNQDYDFYIVRWNGSSWVLVAGSENVQSGTQPPTETIAYVTSLTAYYGIVVKKYSATGSQILDYMGHNAPPFFFNVSSRSLVDPATSPRSFSVAAIDAGSNVREPYSSIGPTHGPGGILTGGTSKPRISGYANVDTWSYGPGEFNGTSSATPHVAGAAALVLGANPSYTPADVVSFLESRAIDLGTAGYDLLHGAGRLYLGASPAPITGSITTTIVPAGAVSAGAQWRLSSDGVWRNSGTTAANLPLGAYTVEFKTISGWIVPASIPVTLTQAVPNVNVQSDPYVQQATSPPVITQIYPYTSSSILINWLDRSGEDSFELEWRQGSSGPFTFRMNLGQDVTGVLDDNVGGGLSPGIYCYRLRGYAASWGYTAYSNEACTYLGASTATDYYTLTPCRLVDTRQSTALSSGVPRVFSWGGACGIPSTAKAIAVNVTVVDQTGQGNIKLYPAGVPSLSTVLNFSLGTARNNNAVLAFSYDSLQQITGESFVTGAGTVHIIVDVMGYFAP